MYFCILIVLWGSTEINCKYRVSRELCKGIILEGSSSARRSLSRVCVLTHSSTCSAWDFARIFPTRTMWQERRWKWLTMKFPKIEVVNWILGPPSVAASRGDPLQPPAATGSLQGDYMVRESLRPSPLDTNWPGPSPSSCNHQKSAPDPLCTVTHSLCHPSMSTRCDDCISLWIRERNNLTTPIERWMVARQFQQGHDVPRPRLVPSPKPAASTGSLPGYNSQPPAQLAGHT